MTQLLVSVRNGHEARQAMDGGADIIDTKEPNNGPLGRASEAAVREVLNAVGGRLPVSMALGELTGRPEPPSDEIAGGLRYVKVGLANCTNRSSWQQELAETFRSLPAVERVMVAYADWKHSSAPRPDELLELAVELSCQVFLLDTFTKDARNLIDFANLELISKWLSQANKLSLITAVAGSLNTSSLPRILDLAPDVIAVRGAACDGPRDGSVNVKRVQELRRSITLKHA